MHSTHRAYASEKGAALVETAIVMPLFLFVVLGAMQVMMISHARIMTEYAAYNAARAGIVHNAEYNVMQNAAILSVLPLYHRTDTLPEFFKAWARVKLGAEVSSSVDMTVATAEQLLGDLLGINVSGSLPDIGMVDLAVLEPSTGRFGDNIFQEWRAFVSAQSQHAQSRDDQGRLEYAAQELDFDDRNFLAEHPDASRLTLDVRVLYPMKIPIVGRMIWELSMARELLRLRSIESTFADQQSFKSRGIGGASSNQSLDEALAGGAGGGALGGGALASQWKKELRLLRDFANATGIYLLPIHARHTMRMQSNIFESSTREPTWFDSL